MSTREAMSHAALGWVKPELDQTLLQMRQQIQDYVEEPDNGQPMLQAAAWLHQVQGTLRMHWWPKSSSCLPTRCTRAR